MFVTKNQFYIFLACISFGGGAGFLLSAINCFAFLFKKKTINFICSVLALTIIGVLFSFYSYKMFFPNLRVYMIVGVMIGIYLYYKSFYIILAKLLKKFYNICKQKIKKLKGKENDRNKSKKDDNSNDGGGSASTRNLAIHYGLSNDFNKGRRKSHRPLKRSNKTI